MSHKPDGSTEPSTIVHQLMSHQLDDSTNWTTISRPSTISSRAKFDGSADSRQPSTISS
jgi:hypothetical protein